MKTLIVLLMLSTLCSSTLGQKLTAEEIISKHLESIASSSIRTAMIDLSMIGNATFSAGPEDKRALPGRGVIASTKEKSAFAMTFPIPSYPMEKIIYDGDLFVASRNAGSRSAFGEFLLRNDGLMSEGLFFGVLSCGWSMNALKGRISSKGNKKVNNREVYGISYEAKKGLGLTTNLYFDKETFRHVRTEYFRTIAAQMGPTPESSAGQPDSQEKLVEDFDDFKTENGITLPRSYQITLYFQRGGSTVREYRYKFEFTNFYYNQKLDASTFDKTT